jgi:hypothetical protein
MRKGSIEGSAGLKDLGADTQPNGGRLGNATSHTLSDLDSRSPYLTAMRAENRVPPGVSRQWDLDLDTGVVTQMQEFAARPAIALTELP